MLINGVYRGAGGEKVVDIVNIDLHETFEGDEQRREPSPCNASSCLKCGKGQAGRDMLGRPHYPKMYISRLVTNMPL